MTVRKDRARDRERDESVRAILIVLPSLVQDDAALRLEPMRRHGRQQPAHAIGFHPQRQSQRLGGNDFPVVRSIRARRTVDGRACGLERREVALWLMLGPFEHQVLEQMREPCLAGLLVLGSDVIPDAYRDERNTAVFVDDHLQAVWQDLLLERDSHTCTSGIALLTCAEMEICWATRSAAATIARAGTDSGSPITMGTPESPPLRTGA